MYCGSNRTALSSQKQIADALIRLMQDREYSKISISQICREAGISRQTFYSLFTSKDDVIEYILSHHCCYQPAESTPSLRSLCHGYGLYIIDQSDFITLLVKNHITHLMHDQLYRSLTGCSCFLSEVDTRFRDYAADFFAVGLTSIAKNYILHGADEDIDFLDSLTESLFTGKIFK